MVPQEEQSAVPGPRSLEYSVIFCSGECVGGEVQKRSDTRGESRVAARRRISNLLSR